MGEPVMSHQGLSELTSPNFKKLINQCIHCGLCSQACPTYAVFGAEMDSPRGRIALMRAASQGRLSPDEFNNTFAKHITLCLQCRACETACPSGVKYGSLIEITRVAIEC